MSQGKWDVHCRLSADRHKLFLHIYSYAHISTNLSICTKVLLRRDPAAGRHQAARGGQRAAGSGRVVALRHGQCH